MSKKTNYVIHDTENNYLDIEVTDLGGHLLNYAEEAGLNGSGKVSTEELGITVYEVKGSKLVHVKPVLVTTYSVEFD